ncbi:MAG TPA: hypothetical protein VGY57_07785 [Vicinamibacterales bacterium]|nr:hypothetical protein [Vicinamibacterales bacterium]
MAEAARIADALRSEGWAEANRSLVIRAALVCLSDTLRGKSPDEILQFFVNRRARRAQATISPAEHESKKSGAHGAPDL